MVLVGLITAFIAKRKWRIDLKWLWCGGLLWAVAVAAKVLISLGLSAPVLKMLKSQQIGNLR